MKSRRVFLKNISNVALVSASSNLFGQNLDDLLKSRTLDKDNILSTLKITQKLIFPVIDELGIDAISYLKLILAHSKISTKDKDFIINGAIWLDDLSRKNYQISFINLETNNQKNLLNLVSKDQDWGENWLYDMLVFCVEATMGDPVYGSNLNAKGWKWLNHESGLPRPKTPFL